MTKPAPSKDHESVLFAIYQAVLENPGKVAIENGSETIDYKLLWTWVKRVSLQLTDKGVLAGDSVGVIADYSLEGVIAYLAILHNQSVYVPLSMQAPDALLKYQVSVSRVKTVLVSPLTTRDDYVRRLDAELVVVSSQPTSSSVSFESPPVQGDDEGAAYIIFTSGTSGKPKPVLVSRANLLAHSRAFINRFNLSTVDRVSQLAFRNFDVSIEEITPTLCVGATLVLGPDPRCTDIETVNETLTDARISVVNLPTSLWVLWIEFLASRKTTVSECFRQVLIGSESCPVSALEVWFSVSHSNVTCTNCYGLSETTITNLVWDLVPADVGKPYRSVPIGYPLENSIIHIETEAGEVSNSGGGELWIGGECVSLGYQAQGEINRGRHVHRRSKSGELLTYFKTGDVAVRSSRGHIELEGRIDRQIKIRGFRVELQNVEHVLTQCSGVSQVAVTAQLVGSRRLLVAYIRLSEGQSQSRRGLLKAPLPPSVQSILDFAGIHLQTHEMPAEVVLVDEFAVRENGKIDLDSLPQVSSFLNVDSADLTDPWVSCVVAVLGYYPEAEDATFIESGGDSIAASRLVALLHREGLQLPLEFLLGSSPLHSLREHINKPLVGDVTLPAHGFLTGLKLSKSELLKLRACPGLWESAQWMASMSKMQIGMILHSSSAPGEGFCVEHVEGVLADLDVERFKQAWNIVAQRHGMLRTRFYFYLENKPVQVCSKVVNLEWREADWSNDSGLSPESSSSDTASRVTHYLHTDRLEGFRFAEQLPHRLHLIKLRGGRYHFIWTYHHAILDGWSDTMVLDQVFSEYKESDNARDENKVRVGEFRDYIRYLNVWDSTEALAYWKAYLGSVDPATPWLLGADPQSNEHGKMLTQYCTVPEQLCAEITRVCTQIGITTSCYFSAALGQSVALLQSASECILGTFISTRPAELADVDKAAGLFLNLVPQRTFRKDADTHVWLKALFEQQLKRTGKCELTIEEISAQGPVVSPLFDILFVFENYPSSHNSEVDMLKNHPQSSFPINFYLWPGKSTLIEVQYDQDYIKTEEVAGLLERYTNTLRETLKS